MDFVTRFELFAHTPFKFGPEPISFFRGKNADGFGHPVCTVCPYTVQFVMDLVTRFELFANTPFKFGPETDKLFSR